MPRYTVEWTLEKWYRADIQAANEEEAVAKFWQGEYTNEKHYGGEIQEGPDFKEETDE